MKFRIGFEKEDRIMLHRYWDEVIDSQVWSDGRFTRIFEEKWSQYHQLYSAAFSSWAGAALAALEYFAVKDKTVLCPSNTFMATPLATLKAGARVEFVDCNKDDLCLSLDDLKKKAQAYRPAAVWVVHIGGHIAFQIAEIARFCRENKIILLEDCAHAHGASWNGQRPGSWGNAGVYSFYATKTVSTAEGGMLVSKDPALRDFAVKYRNYGKPDYKTAGLNWRMSEFTAALGCLQTERLNEIVSWKADYAAKYLDAKFAKRVRFPQGMVSGYYKYIVFEKIETSTGKVYERPCHKIMHKACRLPNTEWVAENHWCVPLYYKGATGEKTR